MALYDLKSAVQLVKEKKLNFSLYKGEKANHVIISPLAPNAKQLAEVEAECGKVKRLVKGLVFWEGNRLIFAAKAVPQPAWELLLVKIFKEHSCASFLPLELRQLSADESDEAAPGAGTEQAPPIGVPEAPPVVTPPSMPSNEAAQQLAARYKALKPAIDQAIATKAPPAAEIQQSLSQLGPLVKAHQFPDAQQLLDRVERLLAPAPPLAAPPPELLAELKRLKPLIEAAIAAGSPIAGELRLRFGEVGALARGRDFVQAATVLGQLGTMLRTGVAGSAPSGSAPGDTEALQGVVAYRKALLEFGAARSLVAKQLAALQSAIPGVVPEEAALAQELAEHLEEYSQEIQNLIDEAMNQARDEREPYNDDIRDGIEEYLDDLAGNELIQHVDANQFAPTTIAGTLSGALQKILRTMV